MTQIKRNTQYLNAYKKLWTRNKRAGKKVKVTREQVIAELQSKTYPQRGKRMNYSEPASDEFRKRIFGL